ncbi:MAG: type II toxin-antitoxin system Phd/YefM family antitoxin [Coxiellaceae bacterium]|nr:type II toxin-antitoxin system Phd/YefM family antitoxin [Coxiellaceae bacterium]MDF1796283.1 type II toxin-antitoxin system Phd/YefM family antitoxin [Coxiellaceae bacterium]
MTKMSTVEARENFSELINQAAYGKKRIVLTRRGKPLVAVISIEDLKRLNETDVQQPVEA